MFKLVFLLIFKIQLVFINQECKGATTLIKNYRRLAYGFEPDNFTFPYSSQVLVERLKGENAFGCTGTVSYYNWLFQHQRATLSSIMKVL